MSFEVDPPALRAYAQELDRVREAAEAARTYINVHGGFSLQDQGLLGMVAPGHRRLVAALDAQLSHLAELADASADTMTRVAAQYQQADTQVARDLDATYPSVGRPSPSRD